MKVLITGASGYIGSNIRRHLDGNASFQVVGLDREQPRHRYRNEETVCGDILDGESLARIFRWHRPDAVLHVAAQARVEPSIPDPMATYDLNVTGTLNVLRASKAATVRHVVVASSEATYGKARSYQCRENNDFNPANPYAASKIAADVLTQQFDHIVPTCVVRSGMGWGGEGQNPREQVVAKFIVKALQGGELAFPAGSVVHPTRDLNHVEDFAAGVRRILERRARGVYNLSGGREYSVLEIAQRVVAAVGKGDIVFKPDFKYRVGEEGFRTWLDVSKAERDLGHVPEHHLEGAALDEVVAWYAGELRRPGGPFWA